MDEVWFYIIAGFIAQLIDGTLGMAYGVTASSLLGARGLLPATVSATVHAAEVFTTGISGVSHHYFGNIDRKLFWGLVIPGVIGAVTGAYLLSQLDGSMFKPVIAMYLLSMGVLIIVKVFKRVHPVSDNAHLTPLGFFGAFIDAIGGGGWGPVVATTLIARGNHAPTTVGSVNAAEFFVTLAASLTFLFTLGLTHWPIIMGLAIGGAVAAPMGAYFCKRIPHRPLMFIVGMLVAGLSINTLVRHYFA